MKEEEAGYDNEGLTLIDAINGFNDLSCLAIIWTVRHLCPLGARFTLNCYHHEVLFVAFLTTVLCHIISSREGVTQGDPLLIVLYGLALLPLDQDMREAGPGLIHSWYTDDEAMRFRAKYNAKLLCALM